MKFEFTVTLGQIGVFLAFLGTIWRVERLIAYFFVEHEILVHDYCERHDLKVHELPTRVRR